MFRGRWRLRGERRGGEQVYGYVERFCKREYVVRGGSLQSGSAREIFKARYRLTFPIPASPHALPQDFVPPSPPLSSSPHTSTSTSLSFRINPAFAHLRLPPSSGLTPPYGTAHVSATQPCLQIPHHPAASKSFCGAASWRKPWCCFSPYAG